MTSIGRSRRRLEGAGGFTLIELMVIVTIIGVLLAIGIPTFLGSRDRASDSAAKARASHALKTQKVAASDAGQEFKTAAQLASEDASVEALPLSPGAEPSVLGAVYVKDPEGNVVTLVSRSATGRCFWTRASKQGHSEYAVNDCKSEPTLWKDGW